MATNLNLKDEGDEPSQKPRFGMGNTARSIVFAGGTAVAAMGATLPTAQAQSLWQMLPGVIQVLPGAINALEGASRPQDQPGYSAPAGQGNGTEGHPSHRHRTHLARHAEHKTHAERVAGAAIPKVAAGATLGAAGVGADSKPIATSYPDVDPYTSVTFLRLGEATPTEITVAQPDPSAQGADTISRRILLNGKVIKVLDPKDFTGVVLLQGPVVMPGEPFDLGKPPEVKPGDPAYVVVTGDPGANSCANQTVAKKTMVIALSGESPSFSPPFDVCVPRTPVGIRSDGKVVVPTDTLANGQTKAVVYGGGNDYSEQVISSSQGQSASR
jgi:hypothetical protein